MTDYTKWHNTIPCPNCDNMLRHGGSTHSNTTTINWHCDCGYKMMTVSTNKRDFGISIKLDNDRERAKHTTDY